MNTTPEGRHGLDAAHADIVRATLPLVGAHIDEITSTFYRTLFAEHPALIRDLFNRGNQARGLQPRALAGSVAHYASALVDPAADLPDEMLTRIGHRHAALGVTAAQYEVVHDHLFAAIVTVLGADVVTEPVAAAWDRVYRSMAERLVEIERRLYLEAEIRPDAVFADVTVTSRTPDVPGVVVFTVESTDPARPLPDYVPGQYISVAVRLADGARQIRQYSLLGAPDPGRLSFAVQRVDAEADRPAGEVSTRLHDTVVYGDCLRISPPFGNVTVDIDAKTPLVLISSGIGAAPTIGILEHLAARAPHRRVLVAHADRCPRTHPLRARLLDLTARLPESTVELRYSEHTEGTDAGRLDVGELILPEDAEILVCGSERFLVSIRKDLRANGIPDERVRVEQFTPSDLRAC